jgi:hypothetical protein
MIRPLILLLLAVAVLPACSSIPFEETELCPVDGFDPKEVRTEFAAALPEAFTLVNTVVFEYLWHSMSALGMLAVDAEEDTFTLVCLTAVGFKIFEISGEGEETTCVLTLKEIASEEEMAEALGQDIRRIYFDLVPMAEAEVEKDDDLLLYSHPSGENHVEHDFGGKDALLLEKRHYDDGDLTTRVRYYEYVDREGLFYPGGVVLDNRRFGYRLIVRLKEIRD